MAFSWKEQLALIIARLVNMQIWVQESAQNAILIVRNVQVHNKINALSVLNLWSTAFHKKECCKQAGAKLNAIQVSMKIVIRCASLVIKLVRHAHHLEIRHADLVLLGIFLNGLVSHANTIVQMANMAIQQLICACCAIILARHAEVQAQINARNVLMVISEENRFVSQNVKKGSLWQMERAFLATRSV